MTVTPSQGALGPATGGSAGTGTEHPRPAPSARRRRPASSWASRSSSPCGSRRARGCWAIPLYAPPSTPGFYAEKTGPVRSAYVEDAAGRWLVGETGTVLYPTQAGRLVIGAARATCLLADADLPGGLEVERQPALRSMCARFRRRRPATRARSLDGGHRRARSRCGARRRDGRTYPRLGGTGTSASRRAPALPELRPTSRSSIAASSIRSTSIRACRAGRRSSATRCCRAAPGRCDPAAALRHVRSRGRLSRAAWRRRDGRGHRRPRARRSARRARRAARLAVHARARRDAVDLRASVRRRRAGRRSPPVAGADATARAPGGDDDPAAAARRSRDAARRLEAQASALAAARTRGRRAEYWRSAEEALADDPRPRPGAAGAGGGRALRARRRWRRGPGRGRRALQARPGAGAGGGEAAGRTRARARRASRRGRWSPRA